MLSAHPPLRLDHLEREGVRARMLADWTAGVEALVKRRVPKTQWPFGRDLTAGDGITFSRRCRLPWVRGTWDGSR